MAISPLAIEVGFESESYTVNEGDGAVTLPIVKHGATNRTLMVMFQTMNGSASSALGQCTLFVNYSPTVNDIM